MYVLQEGQPPNKALPEPQQGLNDTKSTVSAFQKHTVEQSLPEPHKASNKTEPTALASQVERPKHRYLTLYDELFEDGRVRWANVSPCARLGKCALANIT